MISKRTSRWLAGLAILAAVAAIRPAQGDFENIYSAGHADINIAYDATARALDINYEFGSNAVINGMVIGSGGAGERPANTITTLVQRNAFSPAAPAGLPAPYAGNPIRTLPVNSISGRPFLGIGAEGIDPGVFTNDQLTLRLTGIAAKPATGEFVVWQPGGEANPLINTANGLSTADQVFVGAGGHDHYNYGFTAMGIYDLVFTASGTLTGGSTLSASRTFRFSVVPEPASLATLGMGVGALGLVIARRRTRSA